MTEAGLSIREDAMGNIFGRLEGSNPDTGILPMAFEHVSQANTQIL